MNKEGSSDLNGLVLASSVLSIGTAIYLFARGAKDAGIFVGLWAPTFLGLGAFVQANRAGAVAAPAPLA